MMEKSLFFQLNSVFAKMIFYLTFMFLFSISECGPVISKTEIHGNAAELGVYPYLVAIVEEENGYFCAGTLISPKFVLTSSVCFFFAPSSDLYVWAGIHYEGHELSEKDLKRKIKRIDIHHRANIEKDGENNPFDLSVMYSIAIAELDEPFEMIPNVIGIIGLPEYLDEIPEFDGIVQESSDESDKLSNESLQWRSLIVDKEECDCGSPKDSFCYCNGKEKENTGGPLVIDGKLYGIAIYGHNKTHHRAIPYYKLSQILDWIKEKLPPK
ncbi:thrombin-like enzyme acutin isoform X1 [Harmonia axyridis]|uniref:thrombin-like enzyme acutin isoform X1 n=1 Tax=Harmonia axyridis TaxID=115357 RepID=UPI001E2775EC|nr:thrombin-like enzyme acutin isoform X1 [Harmonia axyridis]